MEGEKNGNVSQPQVGGNLESTKYVHCLLISGPVPSSDQWLGGVDKEERPSSSEGISCEECGEAGRVGAGLPRFAACYT
jgi:hypothetical protein